MNVQIVVPAINLWEKYTLPCLDSIQVAMMHAKKHDIECRLLFIDNGSTDETITEAGKRVSDVFAHHRNEDRWGFQKSVNYGVNDAWERGYELVLVCNNDIILHPEAIWRLAERFKQGPAAGMVTCMDMRGQIPLELLTSMNAKEKESVEEAPHPNFSAFMVSQEMWNEVGEFDELFAPAYFEDNDYHYRMTLAGWLAIVLPPALFYHFGSATQREALPGQTVVSNPQFEKNRENYAKKWGGQPGHETFKNPFDDSTLDYFDTFQDEVIHSQEPADLTRNGA